MLLGRPVAELWLSASEPVAQVAVKVADVAPDETSALIARGLLNLTRRGGLSTAEPMEPGHVERLEIPLQVCGVIVPAGHRLRVAIAGADWPLAWPPPRPATLTLHHDAAHPSAIRLPVQRGLTADGPDLGSPSVKPALSEALPAARSLSSVTRQADGGWLLSLDSEDAWRLPERGLTWRADEHLRVSIRETDPASCRAEGRASISVAYRDGTTIGAAGRIVQSCDTERTPPPHRAGGDRGRRARCTSGPATSPSSETSCERIRQSAAPRLVSGAARLVPKPCIP